MIVVAFCYHKKGKKKKEKSSVELNKNVGSKRKMSCLVDHQRDSFTKKIEMETKIISLGFLSEKLQASPFVSSIFFSKNIHK